MACLPLLTGRVVIQSCRLFNTMSVGLTLKRGIYRVAAKGNRQMLSARSFADESPWLGIDSATILGIEKIAS